MQNRFNFMLFAYFSEFFCQTIIFAFTQILFAQDYRRNSAGSYFFDPFKKITFAEMTVRDADYV
jgi:hypothetical protein